MYHVVIRRLTDGTQYYVVYRGDTLVLMTRSKSEAESYLKLNTRTISAA
jgi:hypothetical protein